MAAERKSLGYDEIIAMRDNLWMQCGWGGQTLRCGERYVPMPKMENMSIYRWETYDHGSIHSGVYRADDVIGQYIREAKMNDFIRMIENIPVIRDVLSIQIPVKAIAQHYDIYTDCLDFSGSFAVALFFATCRPDPETGRYRPLDPLEIEEHPSGVIYVTMPMAYIGDMDSFIPIGYSVLKRPSLQEGYLMVDDGKLSQNDFGIIPIEQSVRLSNEMYHFFVNGEYLLPSCDQERIERLAREIKESDSVNKRLFLEECHRRGLSGDDD